ncbi:hypothetical protein Leryth_019053 [Lithospermum erythrorhizon]|nr:hypothetical protein Leryth_019053 [Lithospermum erythrorhizon]
MPDLTGEENENDDDDDSETGNQSQLPMVVRVSKRNGPCLEFGGIDENLQNSFRKYLDIRESTFTQQLSAQAYD